MFAILQNDHTSGCRASPKRNTWNQQISSCNLMIPTPQRDRYTKKFMSVERSGERPPRVPMAVYIYMYRNIFWYLLGGQSSEDLNSAAAALPFPSSINPNILPYTSCTPIYIHPRLSNNMRNAWLSNNIRNPWLSNNIWGPWLSNNIRNPWLSNIFWHLWLSNNIRNTWLANKASFATAHALQLCA